MSDERSSSSPVSHGDTRLHPTAADGFAAAAELYDRVRPGYPDAALDELTRRLGGRAQAVDLGAGTGKLTAALRARDVEVVAVEPVAQMRQALSAAVPGVRVLDGTAESIPLPDASVDAVTAAQAFHWFDPDRALPEIRRVLRPGGLLAVFHNRRDLTSPIQAALRDLLAPFQGDTPSWASDDWPAALSDAPGFGPLELRTFPHHQDLDLPGLLGRVASISFVAQLDDPTRQRVFAAVRELYAGAARDGQVRLGYVTELRLLTPVGD